MASTIKLNLHLKVKLLRDIIFSICAQFYANYVIKWPISSCWTESKNGNCHNLKFCPASNLFL